MVKMINYSSENTEHIRCDNCDKVKKYIRPCTEIVANCPGPVFFLCDSCFKKLEA